MSLEMHFPSQHSRHSVLASQQRHGSRCARPGPSSVPRGRSECEKFPLTGALKVVPKRPW